MAFRAKVRIIFVYGFAKNERDNIGEDELEFWRRVARAYLDIAEVQLPMLIDRGELKEVICHDQINVP